VNTLTVLPSGALPPDPGEFVASKAVKAILINLAEQADIVIVDSPPVLHVGDALTLSALVDGIVVVTRIDIVRRRTLAELHRVLETCPAPKLGLVVAGARVHGEYAYSYTGYYAPVEEHPRVRVAP
jgi:Mrp family chromosome partitioning ATPase